MERQLHSIVTNVLEEECVSMFEDHSNVELSRELSRLYVNLSSNYSLIDILLKVNVCHKLVEMLSIDDNTRTIKNVALGLLNLSTEKKDIMKNWLCQQVSFNSSLRAASHIRFSPLIMTT